MGAGRRIRSWLGVSAVAALVIAPVGARAAFPGKNGKIAYVCPKGPYLINHPNEEICTVTPGSSARRLTTNAASDLNPSFSRDGRWIAFEQARRSASCHSLICANSDIYVIRANGTGLRRLTRTKSASESDPTWSPNGKEIAYTKDPFKGSPKIAVIRSTDGRALRTLGAGIEPNWSPSGKRIAFARLDHFWTLGANSVGDYSIWTMGAANGSSKTRLTSLTQYADASACPPPGEGCPETGGNPNWAPSGGAIAWDIFDSKAQTGYLFRMGAGGGGKASLVPFGSVGLGCPQHPAWSPDQSKIAFSDGTYCNPPGGNPPSIWVKGATGGAPAKVAGGYAPDWGRKP